MNRLRWAVALVVLVAVAALLSRGMVPTPFAETSSTATALPAPSALRALVVLPDDGANSILDELAAAKSTIDLYIYLLPSDDVIALLGKAQDRGVSVRVILERDPFGGGNSNQESFDRLTAMGIKVRWAPEEFQFSHIKLMVIDRETAVIMTLNLSYSALTTNREFAVVTTELVDVTSALSLFNADWDNQPAAVSAPLVISPTTSRAEIVHLIRSATTSIEMFTEVIRDKGIRDELVAQAEAGVMIRILVPGDPTADDLTIYRDLEAHGIQIRQLVDLYSHAKAIIVDGVRAFVGSQNLTATSLDENREMGILLTEPDNLARLKRTFTHDWAGAHEALQAGGIAFLARIRS
ncbi:MAG TPA: phospholipase D-like domain-containing protein [Thermomicrobiales bacterium]|nr:phospholipase D-like domain-containing protein [Thermomicrobiales bacterium]